MKTRIKTRARVANDNGRAAVVVSLTERRERAARQRALMRDWAPAILATFFGGGSREPPADR
jgi:hypothetical protein